MYITAETIGQLEKKYGRPRQLSFAYAMTQSEFEVVLASQKHGRAHDVTLFIFDHCDHSAGVNSDDDLRVVVIRKPMYPTGAYRVPSGGVSPGELFEQGGMNALRDFGHSRGFDGLGGNQFLGNFAGQVAHIFLGKKHVRIDCPVSGGACLRIIKCNTPIERRHAQRSQMQRLAGDARPFQGYIVLRYNQGRLLDRGTIQSAA